MRKSSKKVVVGISGGVDSSVSLLLLKKMGFSPTGVFMKFWNEDSGFNKEAEEKAEQVCKIIGVPFKVVDVQDAFKKKIVDAFLDDYKKGVTPNPCVVCNREIKFQTLMEALSSFSADYVATGHYARIEKQEDRSFLIKKGTDKKKDQSYFLWNLKKEWLGQIIFPLGHFEKNIVKEIAEKNNIPNLKTESQEICFINTQASSFLERNLKQNPGEIINTKKEVIGQHIGLFNYTIGQRKRIGLSEGPYYVLSKKIKENQLVVTKEEKDLLRKEFSYESANFFKDVRFPFEADVKIRYNSKEVKAEVYKDKVILSSPQKAVTSGQSVVFYNKEELVGGGVIK